MITNSLGARIKEKRNEAGLSQEYFAELLGVCRSSVTLYESDRRQPDYELLKAIAKVLSTTTTYLLEGEDLTLDDDSMEILRLYKKLKSVELKSVAKAQLMALVNLADQYVTNCNGWEGNVTE